MEGFNFSKKLAVKITIKLILHIRLKIISIFELFLLLCSENKSLFHHKYSKQHMYDKVPYKQIRNSLYLRMTFTKQHFKQETFNIFTQCSCFQKTPVRCQQLNFHFLKYCWDLCFQHSCYYGCKILTQAKYHVKVFVHVVSCHVQILAFEPNIFQTASQMSIWDVWPQTHKQLFFFLFFCCCRLLSVTDCSAYLVSVSITYKKLNI